MKVISELEGVALGIVGAQEPCTAYQVRRGLLESPSTHWSASAGAIYPLIERLVAAGYLKSMRDSQDGRGRALLSLTAKGRRSLRSWIMEASVPRVAASIFDAVRTRAFFLDSLTARERVEFAEETLRALEDFLQQARGYQGLRKGASRFERMAARGAVHAARARVAWMREVLRETQQRERTAGRPATDQRAPAR